MTIKTCKCGFVGDESLFRKVGNQCNKCKTARYKDYYEANKESIAAKNKAYKEANKEHLKDYSKAYREANKEHMNDYKKAYREANKEYLAAREKAYREDNPLKTREKRLKHGSMKELPEELIKTQALVNYIKHELRKEK